MGTQTAKLKLYRPAVTNEAVSVQAAINDNMDKIEALLPFTICTSAARPASPFQGQTIYETDTGRAQFWNGSAWVKYITSSPVDTIANNTTGSASYGGVGRKNVLDNCHFNINQRGLGPFTVAGAFTTDRWKAQGGTGATFSFAPTVLTPGYLDGSDAGGLSKYFLKWNRTVAGSGNLQIAQAVESVHSLAGEQVTFSVTCNTDSGNVDVIAQYQQQFGTGGSPSGSVLGTFGSFTATTAVQTFSFTHTMPGISGKTIGTNGDDSLLVFLNRLFNPTNGATGAVNIFAIQLERGPVFSGYEKVSVQEDLAACQRYYKRWVASSTSLIFSVGLASATTNARVVITLPVTMRAAPTFTIGDVTKLNANASAVTALASSITDTDFLYFNLTTTGLTAATPAAISWNTVGATSYIEASAELV